MSKPLRISLSQTNVRHLYELALPHFRDDGTDGLCPMCIQLKRRLEAFIGPEEVARIKAQLADHPYCMLIEEVKECTPRR